MPSLERIRRSAQRTPPQLLLVLLVIFTARVFAADRENDIPPVELPKSDAVIEREVQQQERLIVQSTMAAHSNLATPGVQELAATGTNATMANVTAASPKPTPSQNVTINLINRLVERGVLTQQDADDLIKQAENDAAVARTAAAQPAPTSPPTHNEQLDPSLFPIEPAPLTTATQSVQSPAQAPPETLASADEDTVSVHYVPETVKQELREEIKQDLLDEQRGDGKNWVGTQNNFPSWIERFHPMADIRLRYEGIFFPSGNDDTGAFPNFNAINTGPPFDVTGTTFSPQLNVNQDRERIRIRVRAGAEMDLTDGFTMGMRIATGETNTPTSTNQTLGFANNTQGGNFSKYAIWLDRAFLRYEIGARPDADFQVNIGRFDNPFFRVSELVWDDDLGWDGLAVSGRYQVADGITPFAVLGGFPVFNTELNFSSNRPDKFPSEDKYLLAAQVGSAFRLGKDFSAKIAAGYYHFENIQGQLSDPFVPLTASDQGNTDDSRPSFAQKGNTYFPIRDIIPTADNNFGTTKQFQYFGLVTPFHEVDVEGSLDFNRFDPFHINVFGEWVENVSFDYNDINKIAINNRGPNLPGGRPGNFVGGNTGWIAGIKAGSPTFEKRWDWFVAVNYRYLESDAVEDAFNDSDFGLGGTNVKGYSIYGGVALSSHVNFYLRWMSSNEVSGPTLRNDILQFDINAKF